MDKPLRDLRVRNVDDEVGAALQRLAESEGRTVEAYVREVVLKDAVRMRVRGFPTAAEWERAGFDEVHELLPGRQYIACAGRREFRIALTRALTGELPEWNTEIEEAEVIDIDGRSIKVWTRATDVPARLLGDSPAMALRDAMRWVGDYAGTDTVSRARNGVRDVSPRFGSIIDLLDAYIDGDKTYPRDKMVIYHMPHFEVYINEVDDKRGALMVYRRGEDWSITNGQADYFTLNSAGVKTIVERLCDLGVLTLSALERV